MDLTKDENVTKVTLQCNETENKSNDSSQENFEENSNKKRDESVESLTQEDTSDDEDDIANLIADLYMTGPSNLPKEERVSGELRSESLPLTNNSSSGIDLVTENLEASPGEDEDALIDRLLEELNHCVVGLIAQDEIPRF